MKKFNLKEINQQTNNKYLNLFKARYVSGKTDFWYEFASRKELEGLYAKQKQIKTDAVRMLPYFYEGNEIFIIILKEFRHTINDFLYVTPAGLIDKGESELDAVKRELLEETGATFKSAVCSDKAGFTSVGVSDELVSCYEVEIDKIGRQMQEDSEDISLVIINLKDCLKFLEEHNFCMASRFQIKNFYYKTLAKSF